MCLELSSKIKLGVHELQLEELVLNDNLTRPIHHSEKVFVSLNYFAFDLKENGLGSRCSFKMGLLG